MTSKDSSLDGGRVRSQYWSGWPELPQTKHTLFVTLVVSCFKYMPSLVQRVSCAITPLRIMKQPMVKGSAYPSAGRTPERRFGTESKDHHGIRCMHIGGRGQMLPADTCVCRTQLRGLHIRKRETGRTLSDTTTSVSSGPPCDGVVRSGASSADGVARSRSACSRYLRVTV